MTIKIFFDHQIFSSQRVGGVSRYFYELAKGLKADEDMAAHVCAPLHCNDYIGNLDNFSGLKIKYFPKIYRLIQPVNEIISKSCLRSVEPDLIHETYYQYSALGAKKLPIVVTAHDLIHEKYHENFRIKDQTTMKKRAALRRADHVIAVSESTRRDYIEFFNVEPRKITTVLLGNSFPVANTLRPLTPSPRSRPYILFVGARSGYKNFERVLRAYFSSAVLTAEFDLICFGGGSFSTAERDLLFRQGGALATQVQQVSGSDSYLYEHYRHASMLVYPSLYEGFGLPPLEAMAAACPVACTNTSSVPEVVADAALKFDPTKIDEIRENLERLAFDSILADNLRQRGIVRAHQLTWQRCVEQTAGVYRRVLEQVK